MAGITPEYIFWAIITGLGITLLVVFGIKAIANFATVFVPLFVIVVIVAAAIILQNHSLTEASHHGPLRDRRCRWARQPPWWRAASLRALSARPTTRDS